MKAAFRQLAKQYHPDLNPEGKEHFTKVLKAYEVLSDPQLKTSYDYRLNAMLSGTYQSPKKSAREKNWKFDEREMKRRQYYNEHIRKYEKKSAASTSEPVKRSDYNEFKYILLATPLAVLLFIGIMSISSRNNRKMVSSRENQASTASLVSASDLRMGDAPYVWHFGQQKFIENGNNLVIRNLTGADLVLCIFEGGRFVRSCFIENSFSADIAQLPGGDLSLRYSSGKNFSQSAVMPGTKITGSFTEDLAFFRSSGPIRLNTINQLTLLPGGNDGFVKIDAPEFFQK